LNFYFDQDFSLQKQLFILFISFFSNVFSAISGGGAGLIQLPALLLFGIPYYKALAIHKIATVALGFGGSLRNISILRKDLSIIIQLIFFGVPGVILGTSIVEFLSEDYLYTLYLTDSFLYADLLKNSFKILT